MNRELELFVCLFYKVAGIYYKSFLQCSLLKDNLLPRLQVQEKALQSYQQVVLSYNCFCPIFNTRRRQELTRATG